MHWLNGTVDRSNLKRLTVFLYKAIVFESNKETFYMQS